MGVQGKSKKPLCHGHYVRQSTGSTLRGPVRRHKKLTYAQEGEVRRRFLAGGVGDT